jgi:hypothetical protein
MRTANVRTSRSKKTITVIASKMKDHLRWETDPAHSIQHSPERWWHPGLDPAVR